MIEYGYINENGSLVSKFLEEYSEKFKNEETGEIETRIVSIQEQQTEFVRFRMETCRACG